MQETTWHLWQDSLRSPYLNMAVDEALLETAPERKIPLVRTYGWNCPSVSIGYVQDYTAAPRSGYTIVRRPTGGGVVFHDRDLTYTAVIPPEHQICKLDRMESYHVFHRAVLRALANFGLSGKLAPDESGPVDRATMQCFTTPTRYDVIAAGQKFAGAAQRRTRNGILHQGSISLEASNGDSEALTKALIDAIKQEFTILFDDFTPSEILMRRASELEKDKYSLESWNRHRRQG